MNQLPTDSVVVHIVLPEILVALGIRFALADDPRLDVRIASYNQDDVVPIRRGVVITDYSVGLQICTTGRGASALTPGELRVLVMSSRDREHEIRLGLERGVYGYLSASCSVEEVVEAVLSLARGARYINSAVAARMAASFGRTPLTLREQEVLTLMAGGECNKLIARRLDIAIGTVKSHVKSIMHKLEANSRTKAVSVANERGLIEVAH